LLAFLCAFLSYEAAGILVVPLAFLAWHRSPGKDRWPFLFIAGAGIALVTVVLLDRAAFGNLRAHEPNYTVGFHVATNIGFFLGRCVLNQFAAPTGWDSVDPVDVAREAFTAYAVVGCGTGMLLLWAAWRRRELAFATIWTVAAILPFTPWDNQSYFPRYWYLAQIGCAFLLSGMAVEMYGRIRSRGARGAISLALGAIALLLAYGKTVVYTSQYKLKAAIYTSNYGDRWDAVGLLNELLHDPSADALAVKYNLGFTYLELGNLPEAERWLREALVVNPQHSLTLLVYARVLLDMGHMDEGITVLSHLASLSSADRETVMEIVDVLANSGNPALARQLEDALTASPNTPFPVP
jgi:hypothetical protein